MAMIGDKEQLSKNGDGGCDGEEIGKKMVKIGIKKGLGEAN
ncbi:hypothetical protein SLEP1_g28760 [Rubroshorea leprosula]|uniref:Uncharacterized protein n=1 Tax=Rubroshorea leprosula TaxID=152421 RepID=A0AAV5JUS8_9ROSI|nr:hypothetical protein SLEP1_g28760 [Rubroshorea leprosula]